MFGSTLYKISIGLLAGLLSCVLQPLNKPSGIQFLSAPTTYADTCTLMTKYVNGTPETDPMDDGNDVSPSSNIGGISADISYNATGLIVNCSVNYYSTSMYRVRYNTTHCDGAFSQIGWGKSANGVPQVFTYDQLWADVQGCGSLYWWPNYTPASNSEYRAEVRTTSTCYQNGGEVDYYFSNINITTGCLDWTYTNEVQTFTERYGSTSHDGAVGYWWGSYCNQSYNGTDCSPNTWVFSHDLKTDWYGLQAWGYPDWDYFGTHGITYADYSFNVCDSRDFVSSTC